MDVFMIGVANTFRGDVMAKMRQKADLPTKICLVCNRPFAWRKKWATVWDDVKYCSQRCKQTNKASRAKSKPPSSIG